MWPFHRKKVGLVLASGSARGWAHLGVIQALEESGRKPDLLAGTSIGAFVGAFYAAGRLAELRDFISSLDHKQVMSFMDVVFPRSGLIDGEKVGIFLKEKLQVQTFSELAIPLRVVATDLRKGEEVVLGEGDLVEAVRASISIPGIFNPVAKDDVLLVDGGLVNPLPVSVARGMGADFVVAVDLTRGLLEEEKRRPEKVPAIPEAPTGREEGESWARRALEKGRGLLQGRRKAGFRKMRKGTPLPNIFDVMLSSFYVMESRVVRTRLAIEPADLLIRPRVGHIGLMEFHRAKEAIEEGYRAAKEALGKV